MLFVNIIDIGTVMPVVQIRQEGKLRMLKSNQYSYMIDYKLHVQACF